MKIYSSSPKAVLLVRQSGRVFAVTFGYGKSLLNSDCIEERFGLKATLNSILPGDIRSIDKKNMSLLPKTSKEQTSQKSYIWDFGVDLEQDLIEGICGIPIDKDFGESMSGKDSLSLSAPFDIDTIENLLDKTLVAYKSKEYLKSFEWIDHIAEVKNKKTKKNLDEKMLDLINIKKFDQVWMSIPMAVEWEDIENFSVNNVDLGIDISIIEYLDQLPANLTNEQLLTRLKKDKINCNAAKGEYVIEAWQAYKCLNSEIKIDNNQYILNSGKWYSIETSFVKTINKFFDEFVMKSQGISLPDALPKEREDHYNERIAIADDEIALLDKDLIPLGGPNQRSEFCDLLKSDSTVFHVKKYGSSAVFSHLFNQGKVSCELLLNEEEYRVKLNSKLPQKFQIADVTLKPIPSDYHIVYAVISEKPEILHIPFFSKINLKHTARLLQDMGFKVSLIKIDTKQ